MTSPFRGKSVLDPWSGGGLRGARTHQALLGGGACDHDRAQERQLRNYYRSSNIKQVQFTYLVFVVMWVTKIEQYGLMIRYVCSSEAFHLAGFTCVLLEFFSHTCPGQYPCSMSMCQNRFSCVWDESVTVCEKNERCVLYCGFVQSVISPFFHVSLFSSFV